MMISGFRKTAERTAVLLFLLCFSASPALFGLDTESAEAEYGYDFYLDRLILWEERLEEEGPVTGTELQEILELNRELEKTIYTDLYREGTLLAFLADSETVRAASENPDPVILDDFLKETKLEKRSERNRKHKIFWKRFTIGSAIAGIGAFNVLSYTSQLSYEHYLDAKDAGEAQFYQQRWENMDTGTVIALGFVGVNLIINGILQITDLF